jgi:hypothetical protein
LFSVNIKVIEEIRVCNKRKYVDCAKLYQFLFHKAWQIKKLL